MRAIIVDDKDCRALLDQLQLEKMQQTNKLTRLDPDDIADGQTARDVHRAFHYVVVRWLQDQGANLIR